MSEGPGSSQPPTHGRGFKRRRLRTGSLLVIVVAAYFAIPSLVGAELIRFTARLGLLRRPLVDAAWWEALSALLLIALVVLITARLAGAMWRTAVRLVTAGPEDEQQTDPQILSQDDCPALFSLVGDVARRAGSPLPDVVRIDEHPQCYVLEQRQFAFSTRRRLVLVVGLPLLEAMTVAEVQVVVCHEMAHFAAGDTRLNTFLSRFVDSLLEATESERDRWWLRLDPFHWFNVAYCRLVASLLYPHLRREELFADRVGAELFGGPLAARTLNKAVAIEGVFAELLENRDEPSGDGIPRDNNVFRRFARRFGALSEEAVSELASGLTDDDEGDKFDSHPTLAARLEAVREFPPRPAPNTSTASSLLPDLEEWENDLHRRLKIRDSSGTKKIETPSRPPSLV